MNFFEIISKFFTSIIEFVKNLVIGSFNLLSMLNNIPGLLREWNALVPTFVSTGIAACVFITVIVVFITHSRT